MSLQQIDEICDEFESAVREGKAAAVEDYLLRIEDKEERRKLLRELLEIETEWSVESGTSPADKQNELKKRFPDETELIDSIVLRNVKQRQIGDYEIIEELGHGGMGIVYKAKQKLLNQTVAIKVLSQTLLNDRQAVGRFRREMQLIGSLNHPNIVRALNAGETAGTHYLVMEFIDGFTLAAGLAPPGGTSSAANTAAVCEAIRQAALGLQYANEFGLIHRDIKPANLMLDGAGTVKILDLGLGKFISEHRASEESVSLTQAGATLGTVDYMSPEQCENAETADIRSDIYSLGCTLYYLLTGAAPYSGSKYDSARKKLMAHIVGGIPDVRKINPDVPDALQAVLEKMLAKEPADRYQTPQKVAEALEPFASFDKLFALCGSTLNRSAVLPSDKTKRTTATLVDVSRRGVAPGKKRHLIGIILATVILAAGFAPYLLSKKSDTDNNDGNPPPVNTTDEQPLRSTLRTDLALLPGLNGSWWFIETPLYLPFVRQKLIEEIDQTKDLKTFLGGELNFYYDSNVPNVYTQLDNIVKKFRKDFSPKESALLDKLAETGTSAEPETVYRKALTLAAELVPPGGASPAANVLHTQAVLEHYLAQLTNDKQLAVTAKKHYEEALTAYQKETAIKSEADVPASRLMEFLCLSDAARIEYFAGGNYNGALQKFTEVSSRRRTGERSSALFIAELYAAHGTLAAESGKYDDSLFVRGLERLNRSNAVQKMHPLAAQLAERYGWSLLDQWKVNEANKQFESALVIREANRKESGSPYSAISVLHDLHALALSLRYKGNSDRAVEEFRRTLTNIDGIIQKKAVPPDSGFYGVDWYIRNIKERAANTRERLADCIFYGGAASGLLGQGRLNEAAQLYNEAADFYDSEGMKRVMRCKYALVLLLQDKLNEAEPLLCQLDEQKRNLPGNQQRSELVRQLADAMLRYKKDTAKTPDERKILLRRFTEQFTIPGNPFSADATRRETLELRLFAAEFLAVQALNEKDYTAAAKDVPFLMQPLGFFMERLESRPFVRRLCDLMVRTYAVLYNHSPNESAKQNCLRSIVRLLGWLRLNETEPAAEPATQLPALLEFFFTDDAADGFALYYPQDERNGALYPLPLTRKDIKGGRKNEERWKLPKELLNSIEQDREANRTVKVSWNDEPAWTRADDALHDSDYPFNEELKISY